MIAKYTYFSFIAVVLLITVIWVLPNYAPLYIFRLAEVRGKSFQEIACKFKKFENNPYYAYYFTLGVQLNSLCTIYN